MQSMAHQQGLYKEDPAPVAGDPVSTAVILTSFFLSTIPAIININININIIIIVIVIIVYFVLML